VTPEGAGRIGRRRRRRRTRALAAAAVLGVVVVLSGAVALAAAVTQSDSTTAEGITSRRTSAPPSFAPSTEATPTAAPTAIASPTRRIVATPRATPKPTPVVRPTAPVLVLNNSTVQGLAARSADRVRNVGFAVNGVGNLRGRYDRTTICYRPGYADQAWLLAGRLRGMQDVVPAPAGLPGTAGLTLVVTEDFRN
jgi:hypothetical protein